MEAYDFWEMGRRHLLPLMNVEASWPANTHYDAAVFSAVDWFSQGRDAYHSAAEHANADGDEKVEDLAGTAVECVCPDNEENWTVHQAGSLAWGELAPDKGSHR